MRAPFSAYSASTCARDGPVGWLFASVIRIARPPLPSSRPAVISAALDPSGQSGVLCVVNCEMTWRSLAGSWLTVLTVALSSNVTIAVSGKSPGTACSAVIIVSRPVLIAPISGPMLPVTSTTSASVALVTFRFAICRPAGGHGTAASRPSGRCPARSRPRCR